jgi:C1A family cysteine protease
MTKVGDQNVIGSKKTSLHFITVIGWGTQNGIDYWIIKNSFGKDWGESGYFRLKRGINSRGFNTVLFYPSYTNYSLEVNYSFLFNLSILGLIILYNNCIF